MPAVGSSIALPMPSIPTSQHVGSSGGYEGAGEGSWRSLFKIFRVERTYNCGLPRAIGPDLISRIG
jgi:hypothetical protein